MKNNTEIKKTKLETMVLKTINIFLLLQEIDKEFVEATNTTIGIRKPDIKSSRTLFSYLKKREKREISRLTV